MSGLDNICDNYAIIPLYKQVFNNTCKKTKLQLLYINNK